MFGLGRKKNIKSSDEPYNNNVVLPSGYSVSLYNLYFKGTLLRHIKSDRLYRVEQLGKIETPDGKWELAVFYRPVNDLEQSELYARPVRVVANKFNPVPRTFEIFAGRFVATDRDFPAVKMGEAIGYCFAEACYNHFSTASHPETLDLTGTQPCLKDYAGLHDNETDAKG